MKYIILSLSLIFLNSCYIEQQEIEQSSVIKNKLKEEKVYFTLNQYKTNSKKHHNILTGLELLSSKINPKVNYPYVEVKNIKNSTFQKFNKIINILDKNFFNTYKQYFTPFDASKLTQVIYTNNKALVSFGYMQDKESIIFGDFLVELYNDTIKIYELSNEVGCSMQVEPLN